MAQMNFKDRLRKAPQEQQMNAWTKQNTLTKTNSKKDLFKTATNILSQQFEAGDLKRGEHPTQIIKKRNTSILEAQCQDDLHQQQVQQNYYNGGIVQRNNHHGSMMNSNTNTVDNYSNSLFESKLHQTKGQLCQHINDVQRRMRNQLQKQRILTQDFITRLLIKQNQKTKEQQTKNLTEIIQQLNIQLTNSGNRHKKMEAAFKQHEQKYYFLQKQFNQFTNETQEKLEKIMNNNNNIQVQGSMKKSFSRNMGTQYIIQAKNSIKDIPVLNTTLVQEIKSQIMDTQQAIKSIRYEITNIKQDLKAKIMNSLVQNQKQKQQYVQLSKIQYLTEDISNLRNQLKGLEADNGNKFDQIMRVLQTQEDNWIGMNESFHKTINNNIIPRVKKVQDQLQCQTFQKYSQHLKKQVIKELQSMPIIRVKSLTQQQKQKLQRMKTLQKSQQQAYMMDQSNLILDCFGRYLLDQQNQKIRLEEQQVYYLQKIQGIEIKLSS